jgi:lysine N6-hydroxylase
VTRDATTAGGGPGPGGEEDLDLVGVGIGPFNLSLAALADGVDGLSARFLDERPRFAWHPGLMFEDARLQVSFLADLVSLVDPSSPWSFLAYLRDRDRLFRFYFAERFHVTRREYEDYCRWASSGLGSCRFGARVESVAWDGARDRFVVRYAGAGGAGDHRAARTLTARNVVLGVGTEPAVPGGVSHLVGERVFHAAEYLDRRAALAGAREVTVVGSGQSGAEVFLDLLRAAPEAGWRVTWLTASPAFAPMEYSKLGLEHFTPDYTRFFHALPAGVRDALVPAQWQLYKAISADTIADIHDLLYDRSTGGADPGATLRPGVSVAGGDRAGDGSLVLRCRHDQQDRDFEHRTDAVVLATGYSARRPALLAPVDHLVDWDDQGRYRVAADYRVALDPRVTGSLFVQNAEEHTHGVGSPDLGLGAWRSARILNALTGGTAYRLPEATAFTSFGAPPDVRFDVREVGDLARNRS